MENKTKNEINEINGWVICGVRDSIDEINKFITGGNNKVFEKVSQAKQLLKLAEKILEEANELKEQELNLAENLLIG